jgi:hypothetical protein
MSKSADARDDEQTHNCPYYFGHGGLDIESNRKILCRLRGVLATPFSRKRNEHLNFQTLCPV